MIVELIGGIVLLAGLISLFAEALVMPASGSGPGDGYLIGGAIAVMLGVILVVAGLF
jgi:hypothetical protein